MAQKNFKWLLLRVRGSNSFQLSRMHLKGVCWEVGCLFPIWNTVMTGRKRKTNKLTNRPLYFMGALTLGWVFLKLILPSTVATWEPGIPRSGCTSPASWGMIASWRLNQWAGWGMSASWELGPWACRGMLTSWGPWISRSPNRLRYDNFPGARSLGKSRQVDLLGPPDWSWVSTRSPAGPVLGRIKGV